MLVFIPKKGTSLFNMYCYSDIWDKNYVEDQGTFLHTSDIAVILYKYVGFNTNRTDYRRGYVVAKHREDSPVQGIFIPCVDDEVDIIFQAEGRKIDDLKMMTFNLMQLYTEDVFHKKPYYWQMMTGYLNHYKGQKSAATKFNLELMNSRLEKK